MRLSRAVLVTAVVVTALIGSTLAAGAEPGAKPGAKPAAADVGITDRQIRVAVIADVDTPVSPGLFQASVDAMRAWAKIVNKQGGLAGRKVVIDFIDSKLSPNEARNAVIKACSEDFAMVGSQALFLNNVDDLVACKDGQGNPIGLPDMPGLALDNAQKCSPVTYSVNGDSTFCKTLNDNPQTYMPQQGDELYYVKHNKNLHGVFILSADLKAPEIAQQAIFQAGVDLGMKKDGQGFYNVSAQAPQSALTPIVQAIKNSGSNFAYNGSAPGVMVLLRREAKVQGANSVKVWACNQGCYDAAFLKQGGADVNGTTSVLTTLPFYSEYKSNPALKGLVSQLGSASKANANAVGAYTAALLFQDAVQKAVANGGTLNRQTLLNALTTEHAFTAKGIMGPTDIGNHRPPACIVMTQVKNGKWARIYPSKVGTFDCNKKNLVVLKANLNN